MLCAGSTDGWQPLRRRPPEAEPVSELFRGPSNDNAAVGRCGLPLVQRAQVPPSERDFAEWLESS